MTGDKTTFGTQVWPTEIKLDRKEKVLTVSFESGEVFTYPAEFLRVESPSAEVRGHGNDEKKVVPGRRHVGITNVEAVGNYAIRVEFDDLHDTGIYSWTYLHSLGRNQQAIWRRYLTALEAQGLSRNP